MNQKSAPSEGQSSEQTRDESTSDDVACSAGSVEPLEVAVQTFLDSQINYHEQMCGDGTKEVLIKKAFKAGWFAAMKQNA